VSDRDNPAIATLWVSVVASSEDAILTKDLDGTITSWNTAAQRLYGWSAEEIIGRNVEVLLIDAAEGEAIREVLKGGRRTESLETKRRRRDGSELDVSVSISPLRDVEGRVIGGAAIARDITERKARETALLRLPDRAVYEYDRDMRIISAQGSLLTKLGVTGADLIRDQLVDRLDGTTLEIESEGADFILDVDVVPLLDANDAVTGALALARDVSLRRREERNLHFQAELLDRIDVAVVATDLDGLVTHWNRQAESYFERPRAQALGHPIAAVAPAFGPAPTEGETWQRELAIARGDGTELPVLTTRSTVCDVDGVVIGHVDVSLDLTATHRERRDRAALEQRLQQSQKLDGIGRLAGGIAHDFNNLLTIVSNYAELLREELPAGDDVLELYVSEIEEASERATRLTRQLLVSARREVGKPQSLDINLAIADISALLRPTIGEHIQLDIDGALDLWPVCVDRSQIEQVLLNLALNARDAMPDGGLLTMTTRNVDERWVLITVADTGCGMSADVVERAFEPFFTTKDWRAGSGLGLATVYGIVQESGGHAAIDSEPGNGTTIRITLPACDEALPAPSVPDVALSSRGRGERILVVEDESGVRELAELLLSAAGYEVTSAASPDEALRATRTRKPELLLTDVVMPGLSGRELARRLRAEVPGLRILFMSGYTDDVVTRHLFRERRLAFLEKPFTRRTLLGAVREALDVPALL
jgi:two-component system cell cycle sensor histidine kinase/response regulator CckA